MAQQEGKRSNQQACGRLAALGEKNAQAVLPVRRGLGEPAGMNRNVAAPSPRV